jgi:hypothetical protein
MTPAMAPLAPTVALGEGEQGLRRGGRDPARQVEGGEADLPEDVLHVGPEDPEEEQVAEQVEESSVEEHAREDREGRR